MAPSPPPVTVLPSISHTKTPYDQKEYRTIVLPNGLRAVLVQDTRAMRDRDMYDDDDSDFSEEGSEDGEGSSTEGEKGKGKGKRGRDKEGGDDGDGGGGGTAEESGSDAGSDDSAGDADDPEIRFAACSLLCGVGSYSDPSHLPGLAHFLEHMLLYVPFLRLSSFLPFLILPFLSLPPPRVADESF